jgi:hypothetical protein
MTEHYAVQAANIIADGIKQAGEGLESEMGKQGRIDYTHELEQIAAALYQVAEAISKLADKE